MSNPAAWMARQIDEISVDPVLRIYGAALAAINALTVLFWSTRPVSTLLGSKDAICWPFFEQCASVRIFSERQVDALLWGLALLSLLNAALFVWPQRTRLAVAMLATLFAAKTAIIMMDYRLILNQHYMAAWVTMFFLVVPNKRRSLLILLVAFYVSAGLLKLNADWLSGAALYGRQPLGMPAAWVPAACGYVLFLELFVVFGLFSKSEKIFWSSFAQLIVFHISSFWVVGFFYPILMFLLLSVVVLARLTTASEPRPSLGDFVSGADRPSTYIAIAVFVICQLIPRWLSSDPALTGEGRMFALNMFDAPTVCSATIIQHAGVGAGQATKLRVSNLEHRVACDPIVYLSAAKALCQARTNSSADFDLHLWTRRQSDSNARHVIAVERFCLHNPSYSLLRHNSWITADALR